MAGILEQKQAAMRARQAAERRKNKGRRDPGEKWCPQCGEPYKGFTRYCPKCTYHRSRV